MRVHAVVAMTVVAIVALLVTSCAVDPYLTCGAKCADGSLPDGSSSDASTDTKTDACRDNGVSCQSGGSCCSGTCTAGHRCAATCQPLATSCTSQPDTCCVGAYCYNGTCAQCHALGESCSEDNDCCSNVCSSTDSGGKKCGND